MIVSFPNRSVFLGLNSSLSEFKQFEKIKDSTYIDSSKKKTKSRVVHRLNNSDIFSVAMKLERRNERRRDRHSVCL